MWDNSKVACITNKRTVMLLINNTDSPLPPQLPSSALEAVVATKVNCLFHEILREKSHYPSKIAILLIAYKKLLSPGDGGAPL